MNLYYAHTLCSAVVTPPERVWSVYKHEDIQSWALKLKEVVEGMQVGLVADHRQPCVCSDCIQREAIGEALRLLGEVL